MPDYSARLLIELLLFSFMTMNLSPIFNEILAAVISAFTNHCGLPIYGAL